MARRPSGPRRIDESGCRAGFSLVEVMIATVLVGIGVASLMIATKSGTQVNAAGREITRATYLAQEVREWTLKLPFSDQDPADMDSPPGPDGSDPQDFVDDLDDLMDISYSPPRDASGQPISGMQEWSQHITLEWKNPDSLTTTVYPGFSDVIRVTVTVACCGRDVLTTGWLVTRRTSE
jgi:prepilin-type N-terminal cleavage/methylation domain-containing protein